MSQPVPILQPSTTPQFQIGEAVYKIIARQDNHYLRTVAGAYKHLGRDMVNKLLSIEGEGYRLVKSKADGSYIRISTAFLGYIRSTRVGGGQEGGDPKNRDLTGYDILWQTPTHQYVYFDDETMLMPLRDIIILSVEEILMDLTANDQKGSAT